MQMSTDRVGADFGRLAGTAQHITTTTRQMNTTLDDLKAYLRPMVATWTGEASTTYQGLQRQWDTAAADLNTVLTRIGAALAQANEDMQATEAKNAARF